MDKLPLAEILRPKKLSEVVGQKKLVGDKGFISEIIRNYSKTNFLPSLIFWGPPGCGKTTLARVIATEVSKPFFEFSAVNTSVKDIEKSIELHHNKKELPLFADKKTAKAAEKPIVFIDEIHRFNKSQQDAFLPLVEQGKIIFIGATTENPSFEVIAPLISRTRIVLLDQLNSEDLQQLISRCAASLNVNFDAEAQKALIDFSNGDARFCINTCEVAANLSGSNEISKDLILSALQKNSLYYDNQGEEHYNTISAYIKSMRASNIDAALYYLARMVEAGEDPTFIARRMVIFASEDIGMANPTALSIANEVFRACEIIGYPECQINLAHGTTYLANSPKNRDSYNAYFLALADVQEHKNLPIPLHLRNAPTKLMKAIGYGKGYEAYPDKDKSLLPDQLKSKKYYQRDD